MPHREVPRGPTTAHPTTTMGVPTMGEAKVGDEFVTHEFDEAIAIYALVITRIVKFV